MEIELSEKKSIRKDATLKRIGERVVMYYNKEREYIYGIFDFKLTQDGFELPRHPRFKNVGEFQNWCDRRDK